MNLNKERLALATHVAAGRVTQVDGVDWLDLRDVGAVRHSGMFPRTRVGRKLAPLKQAGFVTLGVDGRTWELTSAGRASLEAVRPATPVTTVRMAAA